MRRLRIAALATALLLTTGLAASAADGGLELLTVERFPEVLAEQRGQVVVVNLWATWCVPCLREIPDLMRLETALGERGVVLLALGMDDPREFERVDAFRRQHFPAFRSYLRDSADMDSMVSVVDPYWNELLPTTYLLDQDGNVVKRIQGKKSYAEFVDLVSGVLD